jgi:hypothetical protein
MAVHPKPGECIHTNEDDWRFFLSYQDGQYHTVNVSRMRDGYIYYWWVDSNLQVRGSKTIRPRQVPGHPTSVRLTHPSPAPAVSRDENGTVTADIEQLETLHLRPDVSEVFWTDGPGGMRYVGNTHITWDEPYVDKHGQKPRISHREGYPAFIYGTNLNKLADHTVSECGPAPSKDGTPVYVSRIYYHRHGLEHRDDGPSRTEGACTCSAGSCKRVREWHQHGEPRIDRPCRVTCDKQLWVPRAGRPATVYRNGRLVWLSPAPERYTFWVHASYALPVRQRFRAMASSSSVPGLANLVTWWVDE